MVMKSRYAGTPIAVIVVIESCMGCNGSKENKDCQITNCLVSGTHSQNHTMHTCTFLYTLQMIVRY